MLKKFIVFLLLIPSAAAVTFTETFEDDAPIGISPEYKPDEDWYNYAEGSDIGNLTTTAPIPFGSVAFRVNGGVTEDISVRYSQFSLEIPTQVTWVNFTVRGATIQQNSIGSEQVVRLESSAPVRKLAEFYLLCRHTGSPNGCEFKVRYDALDSTGVTITNPSSNLKQFNVTMAIDWLTAKYALTVNGASVTVDGGSVPMLELPTDFARITFQQQRSDIPVFVTFDNWVVAGASSGNATVVEGDMATGLLSFMYNIHFRSAGSKFVFGLVLLIILSAAVIVPMFALGKSNAIGNATSFYVALVVMWLIFMEIWPDWIGIALIITVSALIGLIIRRFMLGIQDASSGAGLVIGCLGYFIIASTFLGFSGYASETITVPTGQVDGDDGADTQSFTGAVVECIVTGGVFTFGLVGDCDQNTVSTTWKSITNIFSWMQAAIDFLFQLLTFRLPIPVIFNMMIVLPPAVGLAVFGFQMVRGNAA